MKTIYLIICLATFSSCSSSKKNKEVLVQEKAWPACIDSLVNIFRKEDKQSPPRAIYSYTYKGRLVYYVPPVCCDFYSDLFDSACNVIAHPDGGFTGRGDGSAADFVSTRANEKLLWKDER